MKNLKKVTLWIILGIFMELCFLWCVDEILLANNVDIKITKLEDKNEGRYYYKDITLPKDMENVKISSNGDYICYTKEHKTHIAFIKDGKAKEIPFYSKDKVLNYQWVRNEDRILILEEKDKRIKISYYDIKKNLKEEITHLTWIQKECTYSQIVISPIADTIFISIKEGNNSKIYSVDLMKNVKEIPIEKTYMGNMEVIGKNNILIYEDLKSGFIKYEIMNKNANILKLKDYKIAGVDEQGSVYFYKMKGKKVCDILYTDDIKEDNFKNIKLKKIYEVKDIYINNLGRIYIKDGKNNTVTNLNNNKKITYNGEFIGFYNHGFIYKDAYKGLKKINLN